MFNWLILNKNRVLLIIFIIIIIIVIIFYSIKDKSTVFRQVSDSPVDMMISLQEQVKGQFINKFKIQADKIQEQNEEFLKLQKSEKTKTKFVLARHYDLTLDDCKKIADKQLKNNCDNYIKFNNVVKKNDIEFCQSLNVEWQDMCIYQVAINTMANWQDCSAIKDKLIHDMCLKKFSIDLNDILVCDELHGGRQGCIDRTKAINNDWGGDIKNCKDIVKAEYFMMCVNMSNDDCSLFEDDYLIKRCESWRWFGDIILTGTRENCIILPLDKFRKTCESYFDNEKKFIDSDGDGVNDNLELFCDTNPLIAEEEAREHLEHEERWSAVFDNIYYVVYNKLYDLTVDTDDDGLRDYEEKEIYHTDPNNPDTDNDGYSDGDEVRGGYNLNKKEN